MNLQPLFETQKKLMDRIGYNEPDRFEKTILALLVEVGECANEWRGFKYWSKNQEPNIKKRVKCPNCKGRGWYGEYGHIMCYECDNPGGGIKTKFPLLEEYVDGLHFVLQLGIELDLGRMKLNSLQLIRFSTVTKQFNAIYKVASKLSVLNLKNLRDGYYIELLKLFLGLGEALGFTWEQIEQAYMDKNKVNHERQNNGY